MNKDLRKRASAAGMPLMDFILKRIEDIGIQTGIPRTVLAVCPNSLAVIRAALRSAKRSNAPVKFAATLNQVDLDGGYTGLTAAEFVRTILLYAQKLNVTSPVIIAIDHGGPWLKDLHRIGHWSYSETINAVKRSFEAAIAAGYDLIHVDPTVDITIPAGSKISIEVVAERTTDLIRHAEEFRRTHGYQRISYEVGTEEVHGGLADIKTFKEFLRLLKLGLEKYDLSDIWPCFIVGKVGTDLHTTTFNPVVARELSEIAAEYGSRIKGHYSDNVTNPWEYPLSGMGAANVGPEFTELEYNGLMELVELQDTLFKEGKIAKPSRLKDILWESVISSGRWKKWLHHDENSDDFYANSPERQEWFIKTGCRYIWENPGVLASRSKLYNNLSLQGIDAEQIVESSIESAMDKYFYSFNLSGLNNLL
jgi:tagatose-1,6-bisphosphate aldolase non-catalytic subunit AgaZ/GatZ